MNLKQITCFVLLILSQLGYSQNANSFFVEGNKLYQQEKYNEAIDHYLQIEPQGKISMAVYYNLGNAYYRLNKIAPAIYYYEKALQLAPDNKDITVNLAFAKRMTLDNIETLPVNFIDKLTKNTIEKLNYNSWGYSAVLLSFLFSILFLMYHFSSHSSAKRLFFITGTLSFVFMILSVFFAFQTYYKTSNIHEAIVFAQQSSIKNAPLSSGETVFELHEGTKVRVLKSVDNWKKIKTVDGQTGWIIGSEIKEL